MLKEMVYVEMYHWIRSKSHFLLFFALKNFFFLNLLVLLMQILYALGLVYISLSELIKSN